eukprot:7787406-Pyramimonas_sp.AAC.1
MSSTRLFFGGRSRKAETRPGAMYLGAKTTRYETSHCWQDRREGERGRLAHQAACEEGDWGARGTDAAG